MIGIPPPLFTLLHPAFFFLFFSSSFKQTRWRIFHERPEIAREEKSKKSSAITRDHSPRHILPPPPRNATLGDIYSSTHIQTPTPLPLLKITQLTCCRLSIRYIHWSTYFPAHRCLLARRFSGRPRLQRPPLRAVFLPAARLLFFLSRVRAVPPPGTVR